MTAWKYSRSGDGVVFMCQVDCPAIPTARLDATRDGSVVWCYPLTLSDSQSTTIDQSSLLFAARVWTRVDVERALDRWLPHSSVIVIPCGYKWVVGIRPIDIKDMRTDDERANPDGWEFLHGLIGAT